MESESGPSPRCRERLDHTAYGDDGVTALTQLGDLHKPLRATDASASAGELAVPQVAYLLATRLTERAQRIHHGVARAVYAGLLAVTVVLFQAVGPPHRAAFFFCVIASASLVRR